MPLTTCEVIFSNYNCFTSLLEYWLKDQGHKLTEGDLEVIF